MNLAQMQAEMSRLDECEIIGREIKTEQGTADLVAFCRMGAQVQVLVLQTIEQPDEFPVRRASRRAPTTNREEILSQQQPDATSPVGWIRSATVGDEDYAIHQGEGGSAEQGESIGLLCELMRRGYQPSEGLAARDLSRLILSKYTLEGEFERLFSTAGRSIRLLQGNDSTQRFCRKRLTLPVGRPCSRSITLQDPQSGETATLTVERVELADLRAEAEAAFSRPDFLALDQKRQEMRRSGHAEALDRLCPKGQRIAVIEYEASENLSLGCYRREWLDTQIDRGGTGGAVGLIVGVGAGRKLGRHGLPLFAATVTGAVSPETETINLEMLYWHQQQPEQTYFLPPPDKRHIEVAAAILENAQGEILICQRGAGGNCAFLWEFPGGKREAGERFEDCLIRECREELGISILPQSLYHKTDYDYPEFSVSLWFYKASIESGAPQMDVHHAMRWVLKSELSHFECCPADRDVIARLMEER